MDQFVVHNKIQHLRYRSNVVQVQDTCEQVQVDQVWVIDKIDLEQANSTTMCGPYKFMPNQGKHITVWSVLPTLNLGQLFWDCPDTNPASRPLGVCIA